MKCAICNNGETEDGYTTVVLDNGKTTLVFKKVLAKICRNCGEEYISANINKALLKQAGKELERGVTLEMLDFAA